MKFPQTLYRCFIVIAFSSLMSLHSLSQDLHPAPKHPGDVLRYDVRFEGPDAERIIGVSAYFFFQGNPLPDQQPFQFQITGEEAQKSPDGTFHVSVKVPDGIGTGDYWLRLIGHIREQDLNSAFSWDKQDGLDIMIHVVNDRKLIKPKIKVTPVP